MIDQRTSGVLLHPSSLPGPGAHGDLGPAARRFIDWLAEAGQHLWQILPLGPPGGGDSPYTALSVFAGNPLLVSPDELVAIGLLDPAELARAWQVAGESAASIDPAGLADGVARADFQAARACRMPLLRLAAARFHGGLADRNGSGGGPVAALQASYRNWCARHAEWADDYALFMALADSGLGFDWRRWPQSLRQRDAGALADARAVHREAVRFWLFVQWQFDRQWSALHDYARKRGIGIIGDMPIYCSLDSVDVWQHPELFQLDAEQQPSRVAGVPPDYFSATGQLWGNPLYDWPAHAREQFAWWRARLARTLDHADMVRIDHFRGLAAYWSVDARARDAIDGRWEPGPGADFFAALSRVRQGPLPIIAEDLGIITADVIALRDGARLPGMAVLQFAFGGDADNPYLPHRLSRSCVLYTGTHDNDTSLHWFAHIDEAQRDRVRIYLKSAGHEIHWDLIHLASQSVARLAIYPMQDILGLGGGSRMNLPGEGQGQWSWRFDWAQLQDWQARRLREVSIAHGRHPPRAEPV